MTDSVIHAVERYNMIDGAENVTVALSGGADSVALLLAMKELEDKLGVKITAAHLNHSLRGSESDGDERFVREICEKLQVPLFVERADIMAEAERTGESIELAARRVRYAFLERVSPELIATAHTANDNIETVLHNAVRGTGIVGLCGIPPKRGRIIRPLLFVERVQIERFCAEKGFGFCIDSTNSDQAYTRNRIRHSVVPRLLEVNSAAVVNVAHMSEILRDDADFLKAEAERRYSAATDGDGLNVECLKGLHKAISTRIIAVYYERKIGRVPENRHISAMYELLFSKGKVSIQSGYSAVVRNGVLKIIPPKSGDGLAETEVEGLPFSYGNVSLSYLTGENIKNISKFNSLLLNNVIDCDKICGKLIFRGRNNGDKIRLRGRNCTKSFKKLFNESGIEEEKRDTLPVLCDEMGVVWLCGFGVDERCAATDGTLKAMLLEYRAEGED